MVLLVRLIKRCRPGQYHMLFNVQPASIDEAREFKPASSTPAGLTHESAGPVRSSIEVLAPRQNEL
jgi:hypothetical protein